MDRHTVTISTRLDALHTRRPRYPAIAAALVVLALAGLWIGGAW